MYNFEKLKNIFDDSKNILENLLQNNELNEEVLQNLIINLYLDKNFNIIEGNNYDIDSLANLLRYYETLMKGSFKNDEKLFLIEFDLYLHLIKLFTFLCKQLRMDKEKRVLVQPILQTLKESKNMLKLYIPFEENQLCIINNLIGEHLYKFSHTDYLDIQQKGLDYTFEYYLHSCEKIINGYELSLSTNFGNNNLKNKDIELTKVKNNLSFLLLCMIYKINFYFPNIDIYENLNFEKIYSYITQLSFFDDTINKKDIKEFLLKEFIKSSEILTINKKEYYYQEKLSLLSLDTDEYKEFIDIIRESK